ncbi:MULTISPECIES: biotin--[acetyl-CoA-carboxylase] ligase [Corynebacterium]|uniref:biotin--[biotin carboxyl-carrier protein] ligase n=2 Tax=Corynebacterium TaxID=1716 RepID=A0AB36RJ85_9CORY|nr:MULTISPECIES: biotin--[acetyl-CoA-carboxylase] ligase [Corynebacterium]PAT10099.1 biotin--[acetyl-CoA-carboxylase] ligase [Corynebacterium hadale]RMD18362.1 biotin--[acetyl-CoA-carboxylase] ligase [Corynebacterium gottingense]WJZ12491.1 Bifunctional ligase/repressor BirA [Corynebacterium gottingense]WJZ14811.1 Bifunctional ligase/repressor BirA [Corynebacterium gottingense]
MTVKDLARIQAAVATHWPEVRYTETTGSTNADMVKDGEAGMVLIADEQTASKGRLNRTWVTPKGAQLAMSMVIDAGQDPNHFGLLSIAPGVAVTDVIPQARLKWPNDVQIGGKKIAGILSNLALPNVVVGIGINVNFRPEQLPVDTATALNLEGIDVDFDDFTIEILRAMGHRLGQWQDRDPQLLADYRKVCSTIGQTVRMELHDRDVHGVVDGINDNGEVIIDGAAYSVGDVHHLRPKQ